MKTYDCGTTITCNDLEFDIEFYFYPGYPATWDEPACPDDVEIKSISLFGVKLTDDQMNKFIKVYGGEEELDIFMMENVEFADWRY